MFNLLRVLDIMQNNVILFVERGGYMKCENYFCVYWSGGKCVLQEISLDIQGNCQNCIYVKIDKKSLEKSRQEFLSGCQ